MVFKWGTLKILPYLLQQLKCLARMSKIASTDEALKILSFPGKYTTGPPTLLRTYSAAGTKSLLSIWLLNIAQPPQITSS